MNFCSTKWLCLLILLVFFGFASTAKAATFFFDDFDDDHGELSTHTPNTGTSWERLINNGVDIYTQSYNNHATVQANTANAGSLYRANGTYSSADYDVSSIVVFSSGGSGYPRTLAARIQDANNMYILRYDNSSVAFYKRTSGIWSLLKSASTSISGNTSGSPYHGDTVTFRIEGNDLSALVNGSVVATTTDSDHTSAGAAGMGLGYVNISSDDGGTGVGMDNFTVSSINNAPTVNTLTPADDATSVAIDANLVMQFNQSVDVETGNITIHNANTDAVVETIDVTSGQVTGTGTDTITINPAIDFGSLSSYYVLVASTTFDNAGGDSFAGISSTSTWNFTTADVVAPTISTLTPTDNATGVALADNFTIVFDEVVDVESGNILIKKSDGTLIETIDVTSGQVTGTGTDTITINPTSNLEGSTSYYLLIDATVFDDTSGNSFAGISDSSLWNFISLDTTGPSIVSLSPENGATDVDTSTNLIITFNENVDTESGNIRLLRVKNGVLVETLPLSSTSGSGSNQITFSPSGPLDSNEQYYVEIDATAFDDASGNSFVGISDSLVWSFSTSGGTTGAAALFGIVGFSQTKPVVPAPVITTQPDLVALPPTMTTTTTTNVLFDSICNQGKRYQQGSNGDDVKILQEKLATWLQIPINADGDFGPKTKQAVENFQKNNALLVDGIFGVASHQALEPNLACSPVSTQQHSLLRAGNNGVDVVALQSLLSSKLGRQLDIDGEFGPATETAVREWQKRWGLKSDGIVGDLTWESLLADQ